MKKTFTLTALLAVACGAMAQTGGDAAGDGVFVTGGITYAVVDPQNHTVEVAQSEGDTYAGDVVVPQTVTHGGTSYTVAGIGYLAFAPKTANEYGLVTSVELPATIKYIGNQAFYRCYELGEMELPDGIVDIGYGAFSGCSNLVIDKLPASLTSLGNAAFDGCYSLADNLVLPAGLKEVPTSAFVYCGIESLDTGEGVTAIGSNAFKDCYTMTSVTFGDKLTTIDSWAFQNCSGLEKIELPAACTYLGSQAFYGCTGLKEVRVAATTPPEIDPSTFGVNSLTTPTPIYSQATLYVPRGSRAAYEANACWSQFEKIVEVDFATSIAHAGAGDAPSVSLAGLTLTIAANGPYAVLAADGRAIAQGTACGQATVQLPCSGVYIVKAGGQAVKVAATR